MGIGDWGLGLDLGTNKILNIKVLDEVKIEKLEILDLISKLKLIDFKFMYLIFFNYHL